MVKSASPLFEKWLYLVAKKYNTKSTHHLGNLYQFFPSTFFCCSSACLLASGVTMFTNLSHCLTFISTTYIFITILCCTIILCLLLNFYALSLAHIFSSLVCHIPMKIVIPNAKYVIGRQIWRTFHGLATMSALNIYTHIYVRYIYIYTVQHYYTRLY